MLQSLRDRMSGVVAWFIVGLLIIPFAFFGIDQFAGSSPDPTMATVGDEDITLRDFRDAYAQRYQRLLQMLGDDFDPSELEQSEFRRAVLDDLIRESAQAQYAERHGWRVSDDEIAAFLRTVPAFQEDGRFSPSRYRSLLQRQGMSPSSYENQLRQGLRVEQLRNVVVDSAFSTPEEIAKLRRLEEQRRSFDVVRVPVSRFLGDIEIDDEAVEAHYRANRERFRVPERVRLAYVQVDADEIAERHEAPSEAILREIYEAQAEQRFRQAERRRVRHILIRDDDAEARLAELRERIEDAGSFAELAEEHSQDPGSASRGGDLGWIEREQMVPEFDEVAFALSAGELSPPVQSEFGWHLIRVDEVREDAVRPFDDENVQQTLKRMYRERETENAFRDAVERLEELTFEHAASLEPAAEAIGVEVRETDWLERGSNEGIFALPGVQQAAFDELVKAGENSMPISASPRRVLVVRELDREPSRVRDLDEVRDRIVGTLREVEATAQARRLAEELIARARDGEALEALVEEAGNLNIDRLDDVSRRSDRADRAVVQRAFAMARPHDEADEAASFSTTDLGERGVALIRLRSVAADDDTADDERREMRARQLAGRIANGEFAAYQQHINDDVRVRIRRPIDDVEADPRR